MGTLLRLTTTTTLLLGLQLLSLKPVGAVSLINSVLSASVSAQIGVLAESAPLTGQAKDDDYTPPNNGKPGTSQGSGTRYTNNSFQTQF